MNGDAMLTLLSSILGGETIDPTFGMALINLARIDFEGRRPWYVLKAKDSSQTATTATLPTTAFNVPSPATPSQATPGFMNYVLEGSIRLVNPANSQDIMSLDEIPFENQYDYIGDAKFFVDYAALKFYLLGKIPKLYTIVQFFIADFGDIQATAAGAATATSWIGFPSAYAKYLVFQAAARYRMGTDYDDIAARNGDDNYKASEQGYQIMIKWDAKRQQQSSQHRSLGGKYGGNDGGAWQGGRIAGSQDFPL